VAAQQGEGLTAFFEVLQNGTLLITPPLGGRSDLELCLVCFVFCYVLIDNFAR
jgi:hypothetical protein